MTPAEGGSGRKTPAVPRVPPQPPSLRCMGKFANSWSLSSGIPTTTPGPTSPKAPRLVSAQGCLGLQAQGGCRVRDRPLQLSCWALCAGLRSWQAPPPHPALRKAAKDRPAGILLRTQVPLKRTSEILLFWSTTPTIPTCQKHLRLTGRCHGTQDQWLEKQGKQHPGQNGPCPSEPTEGPFKWRKAA